jgi:hypothetical protein
MITEEVKKSKGYILLDKIAPYFIEKFTEDGELKHVKKQEFVDYLINFNQDESFFSDYILAFMRRNKFLGQDYKGVFENGLFIRIKSKQLLIDFFKECFIEAYEGDFVKSVGEIFEAKTKEEAIWRAKIFFRLTEMKDDYKNKMQISRNGDLSIDSYLAWVTPLIDNSIIEENNRFHLDCRCGLSVAKNEDKFVFTYRMPNDKRINKPTVFDAEFYEPFKPGGKTISVNKCGRNCNSEGLQEFVHEPCFYRDIEDIYVIKNENI